MKHRIILADDHKIVLDGLCRILGAEFEIAAAVSDGRELLAQIQRQKPDLAVADISMPLMNGLDVFRRCKSLELRTKFIFLTAGPGVALAVQAFRLGASGYVLKHAAADELVVAIREALAGRTYVTPRIANDVIQNLMSSHARSSEDGIGLTGREREVLQLLAEGKAIKEIAGVLKVSPRTIEFHKNNIAAKTGLHTNAELARYAAREGLVSQ